MKAIGIGTAVWAGTCAVLLAGAGVAGAVLLREDGGTADLAVGAGGARPVQALPAGQPAAGEPAAAAGVTGAAGSSAGQGTPAPAAPTTVAAPVVTVAPPPPDVAPPGILLASPSDGAVVASSPLSITGVSEPGAVVTVAGKSTTVGPDGLWGIEVPLSVGPSRHDVVAVDAAGNASTASVSVTFQPPAPKPTAAPVTKDAAPKPTEKAAPAPAPAKPAAPAAVAVPLEARQAYGECADPVPYDEFSGKATPGTKVKVSSPYGSGWVYAGEDGSWWVRVEFPSAPVGETFTVKVLTALGEEAYFSFTRR